ncbi:MAG: OmpA family protein [Rhodobacteraceae bacterium]|nr:OmpA family protein [Paracoccaceae bacterium]
MRASFLLIAAVATLLSALLVAAPIVAADKPSVASQGERFIPGVWVDPDGCEHWVMDDGLEGYMTPHVTREGIPVCRRGKTCAGISSDQLFASNQHHISAAGRARLANFFRSAKATSFIVYGHTDSRASDAQNMALSKRRANAVAAIARKVGSRVQAQWYGERMPVASNRTRSGRAKNRRVEITCLH